MPTKFPVERAEELLSPSLGQSFDPQALIALVPIRPFDTVADIGSGPGYLSIPLAKYVYGGKLYAVDVQQGMLDIVVERAKASHLNNVEPLLSKETSIPLDDAVLDGAVLAGVLNEATRPKSLLGEAFRLLKKGGWLAIVEWSPADGKPDSGPPASRRIDSHELLDMALGLGFRRVTSRPMNSHRYVIVLRK